MLLFGVTITATVSQRSDFTEGLVNYLVYPLYWNRFIGRFRKTAENDYYLSNACLSVRESAWNNAAPTGRIFMKFDMWAFFRQSVERIKVLLTSDKYNGCFTRRSIYNFITSHSILLRMRNFRTKFVEIKHTFYVQCNSFSENCALGEIMWKNTVESGRPQMAIWRMSIVCWIPKATNIYSEHVLLIDFPLHEGV
jgi:hypothetical protein